MMSKKQWFVLLCLFIVYLMIGASVYHHIEYREEAIRKRRERIEREEIEELLLIHYVPSVNSSQEDIFDKLSDYCGKPVHPMMSHIEEPFIWDFYHSLFFVVTVCSTLGYGNLAPTTSFGKIFMMFYALVGIPINGLVMVTLGDFFGIKFTKMYKRWKTNKMHQDQNGLSLVGQILLYFIPGITVFIIFPSIIIMYFEGWPYDVAVYYAFVTLTTIGFGDYVAGVKYNGFNDVVFTIYKVFLLVWIIIGLGYVLMVMGFLSRGLRSKQMHAIEQILAENLRRTPYKFRALKSLLHERLLERIRPVYRKQSTCLLNHSLTRSTSCPVLTIYDSKDSPRMARKRALSETNHCGEGRLLRMQSDTDLNLIDKELTFGAGEMRQTDLLLKVSKKLGTCEPVAESYDCFSNEDILASEKYNSHLTVDSQKSTVYTRIFRSRAASEVKLPAKFHHLDEYNSTWYGQTAITKQQEMLEKCKYGRTRSRTLPVQQNPLMYLPQTGLFEKIKRTFQRKDKNVDIEKQDIYSSATPRSIALDSKNLTPNFYTPSNAITPQSSRTPRTPRTPRSRALSIRPDNLTPRLPRSRALSVTDEYMRSTARGRLSIDDQNDIEQIAEILLLSTFINATSNTAKRKYGTASLTPPTEPSPPRTRRFGIRTAQSRRSSMIPTIPSQVRKISLMPSGSDDNNFLAPPGYSPGYTQLGGARPRRFSLRPVTNLNASPSPVQRHKLKTYSEHTHI